MWPPSRKEVQEGEEVGQSPGWGPSQLIAVDLQPLKWSNQSIWEEYYWSIKIAE